MTHTPDCLAQNANPRVWNKRHTGIPPGAVYIGRPTMWGNPFSHLEGTLAKYKVATRQEAVDAYREWISAQPELMAALPTLRGKHLVCWCAPSACHGHVLLELANA